MAKDLEKEKELAAKEAVKFVENNQIVGLGTGSTAYYIVKEIGEMIKNGLKIRAVPTSDKTAELAQSLNIPLIDINDTDHIDVTIDGADEFTENLVLIKGGGGALLREKIVASMTKHEVIITDSTKKVDQLGKFPLPVEVIPFALNYVSRKLDEMQGKPKLRIKENKPFITDQGNYILDTDFALIADPALLAHTLDKIVGIVCHGLFVNLASQVIMGVGESNSIVSFER